MGILSMMTQTNIVCAPSVAQSCPTLCNPTDYSPPGSSVHRIFQARNLEWVAISFSWGSFQPRDQTCIFRVSCIADGFFIILRKTSPTGVGVRRDRYLLDDVLPGDNTEESALRDLDSEGESANENLVLDPVSNDKSDGALPVVL